jgi:hypothetical protein
MKKELLREIVRKVLAEGEQLEWGEVSSLPDDEPVTVGIASSRRMRKPKGHLERGAPKWRFIKTTAGKAYAVVGKARRNPGFYDSSVSRGH